MSIAHQWWCSTCGKETEPGTHTCTACSKWWSKVDAECVPAAPAPKRSSLPFKPGDLVVCIDCGHDDSHAFLQTGEVYEVTACKYDSVHDAIYVEVRSQLLGRVEYGYYARRFALANPRPASAIVPEPEYLTATEVRLRQLRDRAREQLPMVEHMVREMDRATTRAIMSKVDPWSGNGGGMSQPLPNGKWEHMGGMSTDVPEAIAPIPPRASDAHVLNAISNCSRPSNGKPFEYAGDVAIASNRKDPSSGKR